MKRSLVCALAFVVTACATASPPVVGTPPAPSPVLVERASLAIDELVRLNALAQRAVAFFLPWLSPERAERVRVAAALVDQAIARVAAARDLAEQTGAIEAAKAAIAQYKWLAGA